MRSIIFLTFIFFLTSCSRKITYYQGYIYNNNEPLANISIMARDHHNDISITNDKGYFRMNKRDNWIEKYLYIVHNASKIDSISILRTHPEYGARYYFVEGRNDTLFMENDKIITLPNNVYKK